MPMWGLVCPLLWPKGTRMHPQITTPHQIHPSVKKPGYVVNMDLNVDMDYSCFGSECNTKAHEHEHQEQ